MTSRPEPARPAVAPRAALPARRVRQPRSRVDARPRARAAVDRARAQRRDKLWTLALAALLLGIALHLGALRWHTPFAVTLPDGSLYRLPNTFASGDHPFHIAKEREALDALRHGALPRWFSFHL